MKLFRCSCCRYELRFLYLGAIFEGEPMCEFCERLCEDDKEVMSRPNRTKESSKK